MTPAARRIVTTQTPEAGATDAGDAADRGITVPRVPQPRVDPAARRIATAAKLDAQRNADAIGASRERCIPAAVDRLVPLLVAEPPVRETASLVRPFVARLLPDPLPATASRPPSAAVAGSPEAAHSPE